MKIPKPDFWMNYMLFEKIRYYKEYLGEHMGETIAPYVDKLQVKDLVRQHVLVAPVLRILNDINDIQESDLSGNCILKASHGSGWNLDLANIHSMTDIQIKLNEWNQIYVGNNERHYRHITPRFFIEEKWEDAILGYKPAIVYTFRCIRGMPFTVGVKKEGKQNCYDLQWKPLIPETFQFSKPPVLNEMIRVATVLAKPFEFVRVDLYWTTRGIAFSEFTFTPAGGNPFFPIPMERKLGRLWLP